MSKVFIPSPLPNLEQIKEVQEVLSNDAVLLKIEQNFPYNATKNKDLKNSIAELDPQAVHDKLTEMYNYSLDANWSNVGMFDNANLGITMPDSGFIQRIRNGEAKNYSPHEIATFIVLAEADLLSSEVVERSMFAVRSAINNTYGYATMNNYSDIDNCVPLMYMAAQSMGFYEEQTQEIESDLEYSSDEEEVENGFAERINAENKKSCCICM